jgi:hypothetical protein
MGGASEQACKRGGLGHGKSFASSYGTTLVST